MIRRYLRDEGVDDVAILALGKHAVQSQWTRREESGERANFDVDADFEAIEEHTNAGIEKQPRRSAVDIGEAEVIVSEDLDIQLLHEIAGTSERLNQSKG